jgi:mono/diheme cytochrome c family protein
MCVSSVWVRIKIDSECLTIHRIMQVPDRICAIIASRRSTPTVNCNTVKVVAIFDDPKNHSLRRAMARKLQLLGVFFVSAATVLFAAEPSGSAIFKEHCTACHGDDGKGNSAVGTPDFTSAKIQNSLTDQEIITTITDGRKGTIMPAWKGTLSSEEIAAVASYVRSLGPASGRGKARAQAQVQAAVFQMSDRRRRIY